MNDDDIIRMAREAGGLIYEVDWCFEIENLKRFYELARAEEREACAQICEQFADQDSGPDGIVLDYHAHLIRARGNK